MLEKLFCKTPWI